VNRRPTGAADTAADNRAPPALREGWEHNADVGTQTWVDCAPPHHDGIECVEVERCVKTPVEPQRDMLLSDRQPGHLDFGRTSLGPLRPAYGFGGYRAPTCGLHLTGAGPTLQPFEHTLERVASGFWDFRTPPRS
jgi:hypothetical protein